MDKWGTPTAISHRNLDNWAKLKVFLKNSYNIEKRTLDFHASQLFKARQGKDEKFADWFQRIQTLGSQFRESALLNCSDGAREGILDLSGCGISALCKGWHRTASKP
jgi:hypothetical protein